MVTLFDAYGWPLQNNIATKLNQSNNQQKLIVELVQATRYLTQKDIAKWRKAWQLAIDVNNPDRKPLYDIYADVEIDNHLSGIVEQLTNAVVSRSFKITDTRSGKEDASLTLLLEDIWFKDLMKYALQARYWGHSLIELGNIVSSPMGSKRFDNVHLIPRQHVIPEFGLILFNLDDPLQKAFKYRNSPTADFLIEAGKTHDLGLFLKCAPHTISKKNMLAFWDQFGEIFGMPIRIATSSSTDPKERARIERMLSDMGSAAWGLFPDGTQIDLKESNRGDAFQVFDRRIDRANSEMSKAILTVTMTADDGSSRSQSQVHLEMMKLTIEQQADFIRDIVNTQLIPRLIKLGFPFNQYHIFDWNYSIDYSPEQQLAIEQLIINNFDIDPAYFIEKYNIPVTNPKNLHKLRFFDQAPPTSGASDW